MSFSSIKDYNISILNASELCKVTPEIVDFWLEQGVMDKNAASNRVKEVKCIIRSKQQSIVGVSSASAVYYDPFKVNLYLYRCYIHPDHRAPALDTLLFVSTRDFLESIYTGGNTKCIGILVVVQVEFLKNWNKAIWPGTNLMYVGKTKAGNPARVYYFKGAKIEPL